jgi:hypothetical protein
LAHKNEIKKYCTINGDVHCGQWGKIGTVERLQRTIVQFGSSIPPQKFVVEQDCHLRNVQIACDDQSADEVLSAEK